MNYRSCWVTITAKVFVSDSDIAEVLGIEGDERLPEEKLQDLPTKTVEDAFEPIARMKISEMFPTDEPLKVADVNLDLSTFQ